MRKLVSFILFTICVTADAQIEKIWETNLAMGNDSLEVLFYKQDSAGNHYAGGAIAATYFVSKFNSAGVHQWTVSDDRLIDRKAPSYETKSIVKSRVSDIAFGDNILYVSGSKHHETQGNGSYNFILVLSNDGDSVAITNVIDPASPLSTSWDASGQRPLLHFLNNQLYLFTSLHNWTSALGSENLNVFKYDESLNLLKNKVFDGIVSASRDTVKHVEFSDNKFVIHSMMAYWPRLLACDTALNLIWDNFFRAYPTSNHTTISFNIQNSQVYIYPTTIDTSRNNPPLYYFRFYGHVRIYEISLGQLVDSATIFQTASSNDNITDALIHNGNNFVTGISEDNGERKVYISRLDGELNPVKNILLGENPFGKVQLESDGCRLYISFIDSLSMGTVLKLFRLDENLTVLSEEYYHTGTGKIFSLTSNDKHLHILSTGKNIFTDTLSIKQLEDTIRVSEPIFFTAIPVSPRSIELSWQLQSGPSDSVFIYKSLNGNNWQLLKTLPSVILNYTDSNLTPSTRYYYSIIVRWQNEYSCNQLFTSDSTPFNTGILPVQNEFFQIYPNPAYTLLTIEGTDGIEEIEVLSITGKTIQKYYRQETISVTDLIPGIYFIRINKTYTYKIIKL